MACRGRTMTTTAVRDGAGARRGAARSAALTHPHALKHSHLAPPPAGVFSLFFIRALAFGRAFPEFMMSTMRYCRLRLALDLASTVPGGGVEEEGGGGGGGGAQ
jgi:hypothetical protein